jgi:uncharacterized membrane protein
MIDTGLMHLVFSFVAIGVGGWVVLISKGTRWHRTLGHAYVWALIGVIATALAMYDLTGRFTPFHFAAIMSTVTLTGGLWTVLARRPRKDWIEAHATWMSWSYIGLMAAFAAESLTRYIMPRIAPLLPTGSGWGVFWISVGVASFGVMGLGAWLIKTRLPGAIAGTPEAIRGEKMALRAMAIEEVEGVGVAGPSSH